MKQVCLTFEPYLYKMWTWMNMNKCVKLLWAVWNGWRWTEMVKYGDTLYPFIVLLPSNISSYILSSRCWLHSRRWRRRAAYVLSTPMTTTTVRTVNRRTFPHTSRRKTHMVRNYIHWAFISSQHSLFFEEDVKCELLSASAKDTWIAALLLKGSYNAFRVLMFNIYLCEAGCPYYT